MSTKTRAKFNLTHRVCYISMFDLTFIEEKSCRKKASCSTLKIWWIGNRSFCCSFKRILSWKIQLHRRRRNLLFSVLKILKSKSLKQNQMLLYYFHNFSSPRRFWMIDYGQDWFHQLWQNRNQLIYQEFWKRVFRLQTETFKYIVNLLGPSIEKQNTFWREAITVEKRIAVAIWRTATGNSYRATNKIFIIGLSTACKLLAELCTAVCHLDPEFISFPKNSGETAREIQKFRVFTECLIPQVVGAIDGTHVDSMSTIWQCVDNMSGQWQ